MNALLALIIAMLMQHVPTLLGVSPASATRDTVEMGSAADVSEQEPSIFRDRKGIYITYMLHAH